MAEVIYRLLQGDGVQLVEDAATKTVVLNVPGLATKLNIGDIVQATQLQAGIAEIATNLEVQVGADPDRIVTPAGLAAAAQSSLTDATATRLMRVGAFGLGGAAIALTSVNINAELPTGWYYCITCTNIPSGAGDGWLTNRDHATSGIASQSYESAASGRIFYRRQNAGTWSPWLELYHTSNFDPATKANTSGSYPGLTVGNASQLNGQTDAMLAPPGMIGYFAGGSVPTGWLYANGAAVSRSTYTALFSAIGSTYGAGNGSSTFNLPDLRGMFLRAWDGGRGIDVGRAFATSQGSANLSHSHSGSTDAQGTHTHSGSTSVAGDHAHAQGSTAIGNLYGGGSFVFNHAYNNGAFPSYQNQNTSTAGAHSHGLSTDSAGNHSHNVSVGASGDGESRPINVALLACIKF